MAIPEGLACQHYYLLLVLARQSERACKMRRADEDSKVLKSEGFAFTLVGFDSENAQQEASMTYWLMANIPDSGMKISLV